MPSKNLKIFIGIILGLVVGRLIFSNWTEVKQLLFSQI